MPDSRPRTDLRRHCERSRRYTATSECSPSRARTPSFASLDGYDSEGRCRLALYDPLSVRNHLHCRAGCRKVLVRAVVGHELELRRWDHYIPDREELLRIDVPHVEATDREILGLHGGPTVVVVRAVSRRDQEQANNGVRRWGRSESHV